MRPLCPNVCEHRQRNAEAGLLKLSDGQVEVDETGLFCFIENGECQQPSAPGELLPGAPPAHP